MTSSQNAALLAQWADLWGGKISLADSSVTDDFVTHVAPMPWAPDVRGAGPLARGAEAVDQRRIPEPLSPTCSFSIDAGPIADEHYMVVRWKVEGTYNGGFPGSSPDAAGRTVAFTGTDIVRIEGGKFAEYWLNVDGLLSCSRSAFTRCRRWRNGTPARQGNAGALEALRARTTKSSLRARCPQSGHLPATATAAHWQIEPALGGQPRSPPASWQCPTLIGRRRRSSCRLKHRKPGLLPRVPGIAWKGTESGGQEEVLLRRRVRRHPPGAHAQSRHVQGSRDWRVPGSCLQGRRG